MRYLYLKVSQTRDKLHKKMNKSNLNKIKKITDKTIRSIKKRKKDLEEKMEDKKDLQDVSVLNQYRKSLKFNQKILKINEEIQNKVKKLL